MKKYEDNREKRDLEQAEEVIRKSEWLREAASFQEMETSEEEGNTLLGSERVERVVEAVHQVSRMDKRKGVERLVVELKKRERRKKMARLWWYTGGSVAAVVVVSFAVMVWLQSGKIQEEKKTPVIALTEIKVPTLITMENDHDILSQETLDLKDAKKGYVVGKETKENKERGEAVETEKPVQYRRVVIPAGYTYKVQLADGSVVTLNAGSELKFPEEFRDSLREVEFSGEGYFEVEKSDKPFIVKAGETRVRVYGTRFNMFYTKKLALSEAVLLEGSIGMTVGREEVKIEPNQRVYCSMKDSVLHTEKVDPADYIGWLGNSFKYNKIRLDKIVFDISQWYGVEIRLAPELEKETFSLEFDKSSTIDWVVRALGLIINKPVKIEGGVYYIK